ncbi:MAG: CCA tRNA nucleotidyltransferase [Candidatus Omnitrophica bacterium]|nr:CCA tRNA nucleotidyltransferase [Candidatus Omnitrophota bacterium]
MLSASLKKIPYFSTISRIARNRNIGIWLVGGVLRDTYLKLNKELLDFDFCVEGETLAVAKEFAKSISSKFIILDRTEKSFRVVLKKKSKIYTYDFTGMRAETLREDLALRDFTINTLTVSLLEKKPKLIDHFQACKDIKGKVIKVVKEEVIPQDPLRILRGFSFAANYGFRINAKTLKLMLKYKSLIKKISRERINEELFKILSSNNSYKAIKAMDKLKIIDEFVPEIIKMRGVGQGAYHHLDVWRHSLEALRQFELLFSKRLVKNKEIVGYLNQELASQRRRAQIIKLACILHDIGKPKAKKRLNKKTIFHTHEKIGRDIAGKIADNLRLSLNEKSVLIKLIFWHLRPGYLADQINPSRRAIYRFFRDTQEEGVAVILLSFSDWRATRGPLTNAKKRKRHEEIMLALVDKYFADKKKKPFPKIIDGHSIMNKFKISSGPLVGMILKKIKEDQALGKISTKQEALKRAKEIIHKADKPYLHPRGVSKKR